MVREFEFHILKYIVQSVYLRLLFNVLFETISMISKFPRCWWRFALLEKEEWLFTFIIMVCLMLKLLKILFYFMDFYMLLNINPLYTDKKKVSFKKDIWFENMIQRYILMRGSRIFTDGRGVYG